MARRFRHSSLCFFVAVLGFSALSFWPVLDSNRSTAHAQGARFSVVDGQILLNDAPFVVRGVNVGGFQDDWRGIDMTEAKHVDSITNCWGFNSLRVRNFLLSNPGDAVNSAPDYLDRIIATYTSRGRVVMIEAHDRTGAYFEGQDLATLIAWHVKYAQKYKNNPYVWFNVMNEPDSNQGRGPSPQWVTMHRQVIGAIRAVAPNNIIVVDAASWGQDAADWTIERPQVIESNSSLLSSAQAIMSGNTNIVFSFHTYQQWGADNFLNKSQAQANTRMRVYLDALQAKRIPTIIGEYGSWNNDEDSMAAVRAVDTVAIPRGVGHMVWAWGGYDNNRLVWPTATGSGGWQINDCTNPTNLTELGKVAWRSTHPSTPRCPAADDTWDVRNVGRPYLVGSACFRGASVQVVGSGKDIWGTADEFMYASKALVGDGTITARISGIDNTDPWAKAGIMMRSSLEGNSPFVALFLTPSNGLAFQHRGAPGAGAQSAPPLNASGPTWVRLTRSGAQVTAFRSGDGSNWTVVGQTTLSSATDIRSGLAVTAHQPDRLASSTFDGVTFTATAITPDPVLTPIPNSTTVVYGDALASGWTDRSWNTTRNLRSLSPVQSGSAALAANFIAPWSGLSLESNTPVNTDDVKAISFWLHGGPQGIDASFNTETDTGLSSRYLRVQAPANVWTFIKLTKEQLANPPLIHRIILKDTSGRPQGQFSVDQLQLER